MKSYVAKQETVQRNWYVVDAAGKPVGRLAVEIAKVLRGKNKPTFTPHVDTGDFVVVLNASKARLSGNKEEQKIYKHYTGWPSGLKEIKAKVIRERNPERMILQAVKGMLPKTKLAARMLTRLKVYAAEEHPHSAQQPLEWGAAAPVTVAQPKPKKVPEAKKVAAPKKEAAPEPKPEPKKEAPAAVAIEGTTMDEKLGLVYSERPDEVDDLKEINGVGPVIEEKLNEFGVYTFKQIMHWSPAVIEEFDERLAFKGRIERDEWLDKAKALHEEKYG